MTSEPGGDNDGPAENDVEKVSNHNVPTSNSYNMAGPETDSSRKRKNTSEEVNGREVGLKAEEVKEEEEEKDEEEDEDDEDDNKREVIESHLKQAISQTWVVPDGGYGWVVMVCCLFISVIVDGVTYTFGIFLKDLEEAFQEPKSTITLANSLQVGLYLISGPVVSALTNRYGCRPVVIVGSIIVGLAFIVSAFSTNISMLIFSYGVVGGIGFGMMYLPSVVAVSIYFDKKRALATGIAVCGSGIGTFVLAPLSEILLVEYTWKWTLILLGAIVFNGIICGAMIRPLEIKFDDRSARIVDIQLEEGGIVTKSITSLNTKKSSNSKPDPNRWESIPLITLTDDTEKTQVIIPAQGTKKPTTNGSGSDVTLSPNTATSKKSEEGKFYSSTPNFSSVPHSRPANRQKSDSVSGNDIVNPRSRCNTSSSAKLSASPASSSFKDGGGSSRMGSKRNLSHTPIGLAFIGVSDMHLNKIRDDMALPLSRRDINRSMAQIEFGEGAEARTARSKDQERKISQSSAVSYLSSGSLTVREEVKAKGSGLWGCLPESARETFDEMMNLGIFEEKRYWFVIAGNFLCMLGFYVPFVYIPGRATEMGVSQENAAFLISVIGITNLFGRVATGVVVNYLNVDSILVTTIALALGGVVTMVCPFCESYDALLVIAAVFGLCVAAYISLCSILLCELLGVRNLTNAFGYVILFRGIACIMGPPIAGALIDAMGTFDPAFYVGGGMIILGSLFHLFLLTPCVERLGPS